MLVHIVPIVPPAPNGLGDYCRKLWEHWPEPKPEWHRLAVKIPDKAMEFWPEVGISSFTLGQVELIQALRKVGTTSVVLHYVCYAYQPKGCLIWLPKALREWKQKHGGQITVMFHEL